MFGCKRAVVETGRVPGKTFAWQLVDAKAQFLCSVSSGSLKRCGGFPFQTRGWRSFLLLVRLVCGVSVCFLPIRTCQTSQTHARWRRILGWAATHERGLRALRVQGLDFGNLSPPFAPPPRLVDGEILTGALASCNPHDCSGSSASPGSCLGVPFPRSSKLVRLGLAGLGGAATRATKCPPHHAFSQVSSERSSGRGRKGCRALDPSP
jgi:hypothetical protein